MRKLILALLLAAPTLVSAQTEFRDYTEEKRVDFKLVKLDGSGLKEDATFEAGDCKIQIDSGSLANCTNLPTDIGSSYVVIVTAAETTGTSIKLIVKDQTSPQAWLDKWIQIETSGHASSMHPTATTGTAAQYRSQTR